MRALIFAGIGTVRCETVPEPTLLDPGDAIVEVALAGICGSDLHVYHGREKGLDPGTVMGHEFTGRVVETGPAVREFRAGDRVMCPFTTSCGACFFCRSGLTARCARGQLFGWVERGRGLQGAQTESVRVPLADSTLLRVPDDLSDEAALLLGDVLATGFHCAEMASVGPRGTFVVVGCGPVGLMAVLAAREKGADRLFAVDSVPERLALAARLGAKPIDLARGAVRERIKDATEGRGPDAVLEVAGTAAAGRLAYDLVRPGGTIAVVGVHTEPAFAFSPAEAYDKNLTFRVGRCPARHHMPALVPLARRCRADLESLVTHRLPLDRGPEGYAIFDERRDGCIKVALAP